MAQRIPFGVLASLVVLSCLAVHASDSSSGSGPSVPPSVRQLSSSESKQDREPSPPRKKLNELGILEGRDRNSHFLHPLEREVASDEEEGAYAGRNRKKKKHRRLYAVEVQARKLKQTGGLKPDGSLDVGGLLKLAEAEEERAAAPDGIVQQKQWTMEELDIAYPDPEGNVRLGLQDASELSRPKLRAKYERSSHLVSMRAPGSVGGLILEEELNYRSDRRNATLLVLGSMGHVYCVTVQPRYSVFDLKELVWDCERRHRDAVQDEKNSFKVNRQRLILERGMSDPRARASAAGVAQVSAASTSGNSAHSAAASDSNAFVLGPDIRTLAWYNITDYDVIFVLPPIEKPSEVISRFEET